MAKKAQNLKPDTALKNYWSSNEQFADLFNAVLFNGRQLITPEELEDVDTEESSVLEHRDYAESIQASRDTIKIQKKSSAYGVQFVLLGLEDDEYLSKMKKADKFTTVITVVVYYGEKAWDGAKSLHEMLKIPKEMAGYVNDYKILLVEARQNNLTLHNINNRNLFHLLRIILDKTIPKKEAIQYSEKHKTDKTVVMAVAGATNMKLDYNALQKGDGSMCTLFDEIAKENEEKGIQKGLQKGEANGRAAEIVEMGHDFGLSDTAILERLQKKQNLSLQTAQEYLNKFGRQPV